MRRLRLLVIAIVTVALGACGNGGVDPNSLSCSQVNAHKDDVVENAAAQLAKQVSDGANNPKVVGSLAGDLDIVCAEGNAPHPAQAALAMYRQNNGVNANTSANSSAPATSTTTTTAAPSSSSTADVSAITTTIKTYLAAAASGDGQTACAQLTPAAANAVVQTVTSNGVSASNCADALNKTSQALNASNRSALSSAQVTNVQVTGDTATATIQGSMEQPSLQKVGGRWLIAGGIGFG